jgi:hypothetical protein
MNEPAAVSLDASRASQAKTCCVTAFAASCLSLFIGDVFDVHGLLWNVIQGSIGVVFIVALAAWLVFSFRTRRPGAMRATVVSIVMAVAVATALVLLGSALTSWA